MINDVESNDLLTLIPRISPHYGAPEILKTFEICPNRAAFSCFEGLKGILFHASMKRMTF